MTIEYRGLGFCGGLAGGYEHVRYGEKDIRNYFAKVRDYRLRIGDAEAACVVCFDLTYLTNEYSMPFAPFVGVNHHRQSILFGCGLLSYEIIGGYIWLSRSWLEYMSFNAPKAIITY
ncbi:hypothetical protein L1049_025642 [Liquidambar formosana]|uniref:MULE transposase domain-containing protein n=1 Tax=Liquidambar formosana TaxID=63359 RepID=A0AAP0NEZ2_LIQFO